MAYADLDLDARDITLHTAWNEKELVRSIPGSRWDARASCWRLPAAWGSLVVARGVLGPALELSESVVRFGWELRNRWVDPAMAARERLEPDPRGIPTPDGLYPFQSACVQFMELASSGLIGDEMGVGKTVEALGFLQLLRHQAEAALPALVICPNGVKAQWARHLPRWLPGTTPYVVSGTPSKKRKTLAAAVSDPEAVVFVNLESMRLFSRVAPYGSVKLKRCRECDPSYGDEGLSAARCDVHEKELQQFAFRTVILDEAHRVKDPQALQTRAVWAVMHSPTVQRRWALTGTPIANHPGDLWSVMHAVRPQDFPTRSDFVERFCLSAWSPFGGLNVIGVRPDTREEFFRLLDPCFRRVLKASVLHQLPPRIRTTRYTELPPAQRRVYDGLDKDMRATVDGKPLVVLDHLVKTTRLRQVAAAAIRVERPDPDDARTWEVHLKEPSPKLDELELVLEELGCTTHGGRGTPVLVAAEHLELLDMARVRITRMGLKHASITGEVSEYERDRAMRALDEGTIDVLLFTGPSGGTGLDMAAADVLINLQRSYSLVGERQKEDRNYRIGSERHAEVQVIDIVTEGTVEERQLEVLNEKMLRLDEITRDRETLRRQGLDVAHLDAEEARLTHLNLELEVA